MRGLMNNIKHIMISGILMILISCIPREDPPEKVAYLDEINTLPAELTENSGLIGFDGLIWFINDSGNEPEIYGYSREQNTIQKTLVVKGTTNADWEDITRNEEYIFIGDFGNNAGDRTDLNIICINLSDLQSAVDTVIPAGIIEFAYEDQTDFTGAPQNTQFDCEAFIAASGTICLFTKDWVTRQTRIYSVPAAPGNYTAGFIDQWNVEGLITSAAWSEVSDQLILLGYSPVVPFVWVYSGFDPETLNFDIAKRTDFGNYIGTQTEGIMISDNGTILISSEARITLGMPARLFILREE